MARKSALTLIAVLFALAAALAAGGAEAQPRSFSPLVKKFRNTVVHIGTRTARPSPGGRLSPFRGREGRPGLGSGFIIQSDGLIVTNHHVVADSDAIEVILENGRKYDAVVVGTDARTDLALIRIAAKNLPVARFGDSGELEVGDWVLAIGNPLGLDYSVTAGIISAKGRNIFESDNIAYGEFLQTDAAINPGNSGGPLFNLQGRVIGVNTAISSKGYGIGFAVPSNLVMEVIGQLRENGRVIRGWLGVVIEGVTPEKRESLKLPPRSGGVLIEEAFSYAPAARAGLRAGDVLTRFRDRKLTKVTQLQKLVAFTKPGSRVKVSALRRGRGGVWEKLVFRVRLTEPPGPGSGYDLPVLRRLGLSVKEVSPARRQRLGLARGRGVAVDRVVPGSMAADTGLRAGDVILEVDRRQVGSPAALGEILRKTASSRLPFLVRRGDKVLYLVLPARR